MKSFAVFLLFFSIQFHGNEDFKNAVKLFENEKYNEAKVYFEKYLDKFPNHTETLEYLGDISGINKNWNEAIDYYKKIKNQYPKNANYHYKYGGALGMKAKSVNKFKALGMLDEIESEFLLASQLDKNHIDCRWALVMLYIELPAIVGGSETKSQKFATELMELSKVDGYLAKGYIDVYFERFLKAEKNYKLAHQIGNSNTTYQKLYDLYLNKMKDKVKANQLKQEFKK